jgi:hypothetical protein
MGELHLLGLDITLVLRKNRWQLSQETQDEQQHV